MTDTVETSGAGEAAATQTQAVAQEQKAPATTETQTETTTTTQTDWRETITDPKVKEYAAQFTSPADAAKAALTFRQKMSNAINVPGKDAKPEEIAEFRSKLGVPETIDGYTFDVPEYIGGPDAAPQVKEGLKPLLEHLHKAGATPDVVKAGLAWFFEDQKNHRESIQKAAHKYFEEAQAELHREWGNDYEANSKFAESGVAKVGDADFVDMQKLTLADLASKYGSNRRLGDLQPMVRAFAKVGRMTNEGGAQFPEGSQQRQDAEGKMEELTRKAYEAYSKGDSIAAKRLYAERDALAKQMFPEAA